MDPAATEKYRGRAPTTTATDTNTMLDMTLG